tara:strand:- start:5 stop:409 length:405 start_codon:yes stop_codon:yes gene_type:complete
MVLLMVLSISYSQELGKWRWADDTIVMTHDKEAHFVGSFGLYYMFKSKEFTDSEAIIYSLVLGLTKETIDAVLPWEVYGVWGGDGFSKYDLYYNILGIGLAYTIDKLWSYKENNNGNIQYRFSNDCISISYRLP